jgi:hypothetical protein
VATVDHLQTLPPKNYIHIVAFSPGAQRASFFSIIEFLRYSATVKLLSLHVLMKSFI